MAVWKTKFLYYGGWGQVDSNTSSWSNPVWLYTISIFLVEHDNIFLSRQQSHTMTLQKLLWTIPTRIGIILNINFCLLFDIYFINIGVGIIFGNWIMCTLKLEGSQKEVFPFFLAQVFKSRKQIFGQFHSIVLMITFLGGQDLLQ